MVDVATVEGPLEEERLRWVAGLYGQADAKFYRSDVLEHLFTQSPAGPCLHAFALDRGRPVGHCAVVPMRARRGPDELRCGKLEALWIEESHRGRRPGEEPLVLSLLERLYASVDEHGFDLLHGSATTRIGRIIGFLPLGGVGERSLVTIVTPDALGTAELRSRGRALGAAQRAVRELVHAGARVAARPPGEARLRPATAEDADLVEALPPTPGRWTVVLEDAWDWYRSSPLVQVLEIPGPHGCRALVQLPGPAREPVRLIGWRPSRPGLLPAFLLLGAAGRLARRSGAATVRFQPWPSDAGDGGLARACRLLGWVARDDLTTLWVRTHDPALARPEAVVPTPLLHLGF
jgi:hypothetical protein